MVVRKVRLLNNSVDSYKIAADTVVAADIDETVAYSFSSTGSTFAGNITGTLVGVGLTQAGAINFTSTSSTYIANAMTSSSVSANDTASTNTQTEKLRSAGTNTGYFIGQFDFPAAATSTLVLNTVASATSMIFLGFEDDPVVRYFITNSSGSFTVTASSAPGVAITTNYTIINY